MLGSEWVVTPLVNMKEARRRTFGGWGGVFFRARTGRGLSVHRGEREATGYCWVDGDRITYCHETLVTMSRVHNADQETLTEFLPEALRAEMIEGVVGGLSGRHRRPKVESVVCRILNS